MGLYGATTTTVTNNNVLTTTTPTTTAPGSYLIDPSPTNAVYNSGFSNYSDDLSPTKMGKDFEYRLKIVRSFLLRELAKENSRKLTNVLCCNKKLID